jgi:hemolysin III
VAMSSENTFDATTATLPRIEDEIANSITHGVGLALSLVGAVALVMIAARTGDTRDLIGCLVYAASLVAVYAASTLSHLFWQPRLRRLFRMLDQGCIYLLIAGTYTPLALRYLRDGYWWVLLATMWTIAIVGFCSKVFLAHRVEAVSTIAYVVMGWLPVLAARQLIAITPSRCLWMMLIGGLCYTVGTLFLTFDRRALYLHAVWHICVIAGSAVHYFAILQYALPGAAS